MKKYIKPEMAIYKINCNTQLMAGSPALGNEYQGGDPVYSRQYDYED